jgi:hypothetical protein
MVIPGWVMAGMIPERSTVGAVELQRGCEGGLAGDIFIVWQGLFAASLGLDSSHIGLGLFVGTRFPEPVSQANTLFKDVGDQLWELSSFSEAAMADWQATSLSADRASSQPR